jgi:AraC-like DNA-binding protein
MSFQEGILKLYHHSPSNELKLYPIFIHAMGWRKYRPNFSNKRSKGQWFDYQIQYVIHGKGYLAWDNQVFTLKAGDAFFIDLSQPSHYYADQDDPWESIWLHFGGSQAEFYYRLFGKSSPVLSLSEPEAVMAQLCRLFELYEQGGGEADIIGASRIIQLITDMLVDRRKHGDPEQSRQSRQHDTISKAMTFIEMNCTTIVSIEEIAEHVAINSNYLSRLFSSISGSTIKEFIIKQRIRKAKELLMNTKATLPEIAGLCGFSDQSHMGKMFRKYENTTPNKYRSWAFGR